MNFDIRHLSDQQMDLYLEAFDQYMEQFDSPLPMDEFFELESRFFDSWRTGGTQENIAVAIA